MAKQFFKDIYLWGAPLIVQLLEYKNLVIVFWTQIIFLLKIWIKSIWQNISLCKWKECDLSVKEIVIATCVNEYKFLTADVF